MTRKQKERELKKLTKELIQRAVKEALQTSLNKAFECGAFNLDDYEIDYELPKIVATALLNECAFQCEPLCSDKKKIANNLYMML